MFNRKDFEVMKKKAEDEGKTYTREDHRYVQILHEQELFGNIEFIGELYLSHLVTPDTIKFFFEHLLHPDCLMEDTVEAAIKLMERIGPKIEEGIAIDESNNKISQKDYNIILHKFKKIWEDSENVEEGIRKVCMRIQKLI